MADYWAKVYIEILDDPKMAILPDRLWRRIIELILVAKKLNSAGHLPETRQIAWMLRMNPDDLEADMVQIAQTGIVEREVNGWYLPKFEKRQGPVPDVERKRQQREREQRREYYEGVTPQSRNVTQRTETDTETETETKTETTTSSRDFAELSRAYEHNIGPITSMTADMLADDLEHYGLQICLDAILKAVEQNKRKWSYVRGIMRNWWTDGRTGNGKVGVQSGPQKIVLPDGQIVEANL